LQAAGVGFHNRTFIETRLQVVFISRGTSPATAKSTPVWVKSGIWKWQLTLCYS